MPTSYPRYASYSFGPGPLTPAVRALVIANVALFLAAKLAPTLLGVLGLVPRDVLERLWVWQPVTYMFMHAGVAHLVFNMLTLWMFGVDLERRWGSSFFARFYFVCGLVAGVATMLVSLLPADFAIEVYGLPTVGSSGAIYGLLVGFAMTYPNRPILVFLMFPLPARVAVLLFGALALYFAVSEPFGGVAHAAHLGGAVAGYLYLAGQRGHLFSTIRSQWLRWRLARMRKRFAVHDGGRRDGGGPMVH
jgi:membrane associated rhomboid family serine protease